MVLEHSRSTNRYCKKPDSEEELLTERIVSLASDYGRYGYRRITALLRNEGKTNSKSGIINGGRSRESQN